MKAFHPAQAKIISAPPMDGKRERLCWVGESSVNRIAGPKRYSGMVEWLQASPKPAQRDPSSFFKLDLNGASFMTLYSPKDPLHPILRFLSMQFARSLFPETLSRIDELRVSYGGGRLVSAIYSPGAGLASVPAGPGLEISMRALELSGIMMSQAHSICDLCDGRIIPFEIRGIRLKDAFMAAARYSSEPEESLALLSLIYSAMLRDYARKNPGYLCKYKGYCERGFDEIASAVFWSLIDSAPGPLEDAPRRTSHGMDFFCGFRDLFHGVHMRAALSASGALADPVKLDWPVSVDLEFV